MAVTQGSTQVYEFGAFRLEAAERRLLRAGEVVPLTPKAFDVLLALVEQSGKLLEKETLLKTVWPDSFVEENNLADNISRVRKALGEGEDGRKFIETVPRRGYRFVAGVKVIAPDSSALATAGTDAASVPAANSPAIPQSVSPAAPHAQLARRWPWMLGLLALTSVLLVGMGVWLSIRAERRAELEKLEFKGEFYTTRWTQEYARKGIEHFTQAVTLNPNSATAYVGLSGAWAFMSDLYLSPREAMPKAQAAAVTAVQLDDRLPEAHIALAWVKMRYEWDWAGAEAEYRRALALDPKNGEARRLHSYYLNAQGRFEETRAEVRRDMEADPLNETVLWEIGLSFYFARRYEPAIEQFRRAIGVEPKSHLSHLLLGWSYEQQGKFPEAVRELNLASQMNDSPLILASLGHAWAVAGQRTEAQKMLASLEEESHHKYVSPYGIAALYAGLGEKEQALAWLEKAYEDRCGWLAFFLKVDPKFDTLRADERFRDLLRRVGHAP